MALRALALLGLLSAASQAANACWSSQFACRDGRPRCVSWPYRCDGANDCDDGSDEDGCSATMVTLLPNATVTARVGYDEDHGAIAVHLCGSDHCSSVRLWGEASNGTMRYSTSSGCNHRAVECSAEQSFGQYDREFPAGGVVLQIQRRPGELAVWRHGRPDDVAVVPVADSNDSLRVWPHFWSSIMPVQFNETQLTSEHNARNI
ncbi:low-density lipoprotein receptor-related protein 2-like [Thrips palmi]|uniref:Low-density lipoprotein receptor-related protein 2-like n=1 Tax=Thrips palmi TaxID=161013 RepID=A0A6P8YVY9_THRPL|nr:low-density lipoprotein receptor-related protein 2-like [Thrips palmi]